MLSLILYLNIDLFQQQKKKQKKNYLQYIIMRILFSYE